MDKLKYWEKSSSFTYNNQTWTLHVEFVTNDFELIDRDYISHESLMLLHKGIINIIHSFGIPRPKEIIDFNGYNVIESVIYDIDSLKITFQLNH